jgi:transposase InsO family protein
MPKFTTAFDDAFTGNGTRVINTSVRSPRAGSFAERFVGTLRRECLDHVLILGEQHLRNVLAGYARHYNGHRPHQSLQQELPQRQPGNASAKRQVSADERVRIGKGRLRHPEKQPGPGRITIPPTKPGPNVNMDPA